MRFGYHQGRLFPTQLPSQWSINLVMVLSFKFQQCFNPFTKLTVEGSSETGLSRLLSNHMSRSPYFRKYINYQSHPFFWKCLKFNVDLKNGGKNCEKNTCFLDNCICIGSIKLSLLRTEDFPSARNVLTNSLKILHITKREFFQLIFLHSDQWISYRCCSSDFKVGSACLPCCF